MRALLLMIPLATCAGDETVSGYAPDGVVWRLAEVDGAAFTARATIEFPEEGQIAGQAPCNRYSGSQSAPYPWFEPGPLLSTKMACPDLDAEDTFFNALGDMTLAEVTETVLILSNDAGREMVFYPDS